ncbi:leucine-rich repeat extensin-like protein 6 [Andrographis paniculata]|uniref:leucine-rich repeat extensin-like protein 6 n=1 Tax=Andrographis paniculata TaxID=175694 RepID=UPI0021E8255A|nr:leucine-rich repeat extensin-like protein 6 [Andrographis paniculata]
MHLLSTVIFLCFTFSSVLTQARGGTSAVVVGTVYCNNTCLGFAESIPGASIAVECKNLSSSLAPNFRQILKTNKDGNFKVHLPFSPQKHAKTIKQCSVRLISSNKPLCDVPAMATAAASFHLLSRKHGTLIFSPGPLTFRPFKDNQACDQKPTTINFKKSKNAQNELTPIPNQNEETAQLLDRKADQPFTPPQIPQNPFYPPYTFPPNPFQPPTSSLPPNPNFQPPPSGFPPFFPSPAIPSLVPPPPPPRPSFPFPFPPFPFQPTPGFPGAPPAEALLLSP